MFTGPHPACPGGASRRITFSSDEETQGFWGYIDGQRDSYSVLNARIDIGKLESGHTSRPVIK